MDDHASLQAQVIALDKRVSRHDEHLKRLDDDMAEIRNRLDNTATKADVAAVSAQIDKSINGILRDALNAMPMKQSILWAAVMAGVAIATLVIGVTHGVH